MDEEWEATEQVRRQIHADIDIERSNQDGQWGGVLHDQDHKANDWIAFIVRQLGKAHDDWEEDRYEEYRQRMIKVAALAVAAIEAVES